MKWKNLAFVLSWFVVCLTICTSDATAGAAAKDSSLTDYVVRHCLTAANARTGRESIILFVDFLRFGCMSCLNQFLDLCDTLKDVSRKEGPLNVVVVFKRDGQAENVQSRAMRSWLNGSGLSLPMTIIPAEVFTSFGVEGTALMILDRHKEFAFYGPIPSTPAERTSAVDRIVALKRLPVR